MCGIAVNSSGSRKKKERRKVIEKENSYDELYNADLILCNNEKNQKHHKI